MTPQIKKRIEQIRRGEVPEGYKKTSTGIVPMEWEEKRIGDVFIQRNTLMTISEDAPLLSFTIEEGIIDPSDKKSNKRDFLIKDISAKKFALTEVGDIIYNPANIKFGAIHRNNLRRGVVSPIYGIFYGNQDSEFMGYLLHSQRFIDYVKIYTEGTVEKLKTLKPDTFLKLKISLPTNNAEQKKITEILKSQDQVIVLYEKKIEQLKKLKKVFLQKMFPKPGCTVPEWRFTEFSDTWEQCKFSDLAETRRGLTYNPSNIRESGVRVLRSSNIAEDQFVFSDEDVFVEPAVINIPWINKGDILITSANGSTRLVGKHAIIREIPDKSAVHGGFMLLATAKNPEFVNALMGSPWYSNFISLYVAGGNGAIGNLNKNDLDQQFVYAPSEPEQDAIGEFFNHFDNLITLNQRKCDEEKQKKKALMQLLLTGIVRVK